MLSFKRSPYYKLIQSAIFLTLASVIFWSANVRAFEALDGQNQTTQMAHDDASPDDTDASSDETDQCDQADDLPSICWFFSHPRIRPLIQIVNIISAASLSAPSFSIPPLDKPPKV